MCTLSFLPTKHGYAAAMNRDELFSRAAALPPQKCTLNGTEAIYPREPAGGTWIACNSHGSLLALLNWNVGGPEQLSGKLKSRGEIIPLLIGAPDRLSTELDFEKLPLAGTFPFRLIGIFRREQAVREWRWDGARAQMEQLPWSRNHWFSSSISDCVAEIERGKMCRFAPQAQDGQEVEWLRTLHRAHGMRPGAFSICMHRPDAATVSYAEVDCTGELTRMTYQEGSPCLGEHALNSCAQAMATPKKSQAALIS